MKVLCSCVPGYGHFHPLLPIASALQSGGHDVTFVLEEAFGVHATKAGFKTVAAGEDAASPAMRAMGDHPEFFSLSPLAKREFMMREVFAGARMESGVEALTNAARGLDPDVILHDPGEYCAPLVAGLRQVPNVCVGYGLALQPALRSAAGRAAAPRWEGRGLDPPADGGQYRCLYLDPCPPSLRGPEAVDIPTSSPIRAIPFGGSGGPVPDTLAGLDDRPLVYVTLGTAYSNRAALEQIIEGLRRLEVNVVVTVGPDGDPAAVDPGAPNVVVERFIPQGSLLPRCALVVTHGGSGSMLGPLSLGVPVVVAPIGADQFENADAVVRSGAGTAILPTVLNAEAVTVAARQVLGGSSYRAAAAAIASEIADMPHPDAIVTQIEALARRR